jgi:methylphosphotriester-DNA--protein-cysteine methyltransferase
MKKTGKFLLIIILVCMIAVVGYAAGQDTVVYITKTGEKYHTGQCSSLKKSRISISLGDAVAKGYGPCQRCKPPILDIDEDEEE